MTQAERLLRFIREHPGCSILDMARGMDPFIANPRARISELRQDGHEIRCERRRDGIDGYRVIEVASQQTLELAG